MASLRTLEQALKDILKDAERVTKYDAQALKALILADGRVSTEERLFLERALQDNILDEQAYQMLSQMLLREELG